MSVAPTKAKTAVSPISPVPSSLSGEAYSGLRLLKEVYKAPRSKCRHNALRTIRDDVVLEFVARSGRRAEFLVPRRTELVVFYPPRGCEADHILAVFKFPREFDGSASLNYNETHVVVKGDLTIRWRRLRGRMQPERPWLAELDRLMPLPASRRSAVSFFE